MVNITPDMLAPITDTVTNNLPQIVTVGMGLVAVAIGVKFVVRTVKSFI